MPEARAVPEPFPDAPAESTSPVVTPALSRATEVPLASAGDRAWWSGRPRPPRGADPAGGPPRLGPRLRPRSLLGVGRQGEAEDVSRDEVPGGRGVGAVGEDAARGADAGRALDRPVSRLTSRAAPSGPFSCRNDTAPPAAVTEFRMTQCVPGMAISHTQV